MRTQRADYVAPILERAELFIQAHPEKFGRGGESGDTVLVEEGEAGRS